MGHLFHAFLRRYDPDQVLGVVFSAALPLEKTSQPELRLPPVMGCSLYGPGTGDWQDGWGRGKLFPMIEGFWISLARVGGLAFFLLLAAPEHTARALEPPHFSSGEVTVISARGRFVFSVELALNGAQRTQGLQFREWLAPSAGMLFDFQTSRPVTMWMKNTLIPLDMIFIGDDGRIRNIAAMTVPKSLRTVSSAGPVRYVLEVNGGTATRLGLKAGDRVKVP